MLLILLIFLPIAYGIRLNSCSDSTYKNMVFHMCEDLVEYEHVYFHDVTGENRVRLVNNKLYRNHGKYTSMFKNDLLYVGKTEYTDDEWLDAFENVGL